MELLEVTTSRETTKESVTEAEEVVVNGVPVSKPSPSTMQASDFSLPADARPARRPGPLVSSLVRPRENLHHPRASDHHRNQSPCVRPADPHEPFPPRHPAEAPHDGPRQRLPVTPVHAFSIKDGNIMTV